MLPNSLPWPILEDTEVKAIGCVYNHSGELRWPTSTQSAYTITETYTIIPGDIYFPSKLHDGQKITLRSANATKICFSLDANVVPSCPSSPDAAHCNLVDMYEPKARLQYYIQTRPYFESYG